MSIVKPEDYDTETLRGVIKKARPLFDKNEYYLPPP
jgi:hypothetical protein